MHDRQMEVDRNWEAFREMLPSLLNEHREKYALMKNKKIMGYFSSYQDAISAADSFIKDGLYSVQQVTDFPINLGYFTHAVHIDPIQS